MRFEKEINIYGDQVILKRFLANETSISVVQGKISALISESELVELENSQITMYSKLASAIMDIDSLTLSFSDLTTKYNTVSGQYTALDSKVAEYKAGVDGLSANLTRVSQDLSENYSTTIQMNAAIDAKANEISLSVSSAVTRVEKLETWKSEASLKIADSAIISTVISSSSYENSVESLIEQNADSIRLKADQISWESTYSSMTSAGTLTCRNATIEGTIHSDNGDDEIYMRSARLEFIRDGVDIGNIGTNNLSASTSTRGLVFDLEYTGNYMAWAAKASASATSYDIKWLYARSAISSYSYPADTLNAGCDIMMRGYNLCFGTNTNHRIFNYSNGIGIYSNDNIFLEIGSSATSILSIDSEGLHTNKLLEVGGGGGITAYNDTKLNFYSDLNMHNFSVLNNSDERLKENISDPDISAIDVVYGMQVCQYDWRGSGNHVSAGLIAQQVMEIVPEAVKQDGDGLYAIDYISLIPYLIGAIQYLYEVQMKKKNKKAKYVIEEYSEEEISEALRKAAAPVQIKKEKIRVVPESVKFKMK